VTVVVVSTGGTIASRPDPATGKLVPAVGAADLLATLAWPDAPPLEVDDFAQVPSWELFGALAFRLAARVQEHVRREDVDGVVVTHGTDTMEETVYLVDRAVEGEKPVVLTGAQRTADARDADGPRNLRDAIAVAASPAARGRGAMIAFAGELHAAREVRKVHTSALAAFASPGYGPLGHVDTDRIVFRRRPERSPALRPDGATDVLVDLIRLHAGSDGRFVRASVASGARALVLEATGRGNANERVVEAVREATQAGVPVVVCTRCAEGRVEPLYGRGGGRDLEEAGALFAGDLAGPKARVLLQLALAAGVDPAAVIAKEEYA
jgi:L-asparaginase